MSVFRSMKWRLTFRVLPLVLSVILTKFLVHSYHLEVLSLSPLMGALISANVFLIGFLISGVLSDYKESEKLPGEMACSLDVIVDESTTLYQHKKTPAALALLEHVQDLTDTLARWFHKEEKTGAVMEKIAALNPLFYGLEGQTQANFIARLKQEQHALRRTVTRIHTIRETDFNPAGYAIAEILSTILCLALIFTKVEPYHESVFFVAFVSFVLIYMVRLIKEIDNPFSYYDDNNLTETIPLKPLLSFQAQLTQKIAALKASDTAGA